METAEKQDSKRQQEMAFCDKMDIAISNGQDSYWRNGKTVTSERGRDSDQRYSNHSYRVASIAELLTIAKGCFKSHHLSRQAVEPWGWVSGHRATASCRPAALCSSSPTGAQPTQAGEPGGSSRRPHVRDCLASFWFLHTCKCPLCPPAPYQMIQEISPLAR